MVRYSPANTKLQKLAKKIHGKIYSLDLQAGVSCPYAKDCKCTVFQNGSGLRLKDGPHTKFRCYAASIEVRLPNVFKLHRNNYISIKKTHGVKKITSLLEKTFPQDATVVRFHSSGDFFKEEYFIATMRLAENHPNILFYAYTKALPLWVKHRGAIPANFKLIASKGGTCDDLIDKYKLQYSQVVLSHYEGKKLNLPINIDDSNCITNENFALLIHSPQPKGSVAAKRYEKIKRRKS